MVNIQIRDVPEPIRDAIAEVARTRGQSMQSYLLDVLEQEARRANNIALLDEVRRVGGGCAAEPGETAAEIDMLRSARSA